MEQLRELIDGSLSPRDAKILFQVFIKEYATDDAIANCFVAFSQFKMENKNK